MAARAGDDGETWNKGPILLSAGAGNRTPLSTVTHGGENSGVVQGEFWPGSHYVTPHSPNPRTKYSVQLPTC